MRTISKDLMPYYLLKFGLSKGLERMGQQKTSQFVEQFQFNATINEKIQISDVVMTHCFYIANELITNLVKHSHPSSIEMSLDCDGNFLNLLIKHNGIALSQQDYLRLSQNSDSLGLENIRFRLNIIDGELLFKRSASCGEINLRSPLIK